VLLLQDATPSLPDVNEGDAASSTADTNAQASTTNSSLVIGAIASTNSGSFSGSVSGCNTAPTSPPSMSVGSVSPRVAADLSKTSTPGSRGGTVAGVAAAAAAAGSGDAGPDQSGQLGAAAINQAHWSQPVSAYPKVTVDTLPAAAVTAAGCSVCAGAPATATAAGGSCSVAVTGSGMGNCGVGSTATPGSVTAAARELVALTAAPTLEVRSAAVVVQPLQGSGYALQLMPVELKACMLWA
jgi:hypothetical protein